MSNSIEVVINNKKYVVKKFTVEMDIKRALLSNLVNATIHAEDTSSQPLLRIASTIYIPLHSCTFPIDPADELPSLSDFLELDGIEANNWRIAGQTLNPTWFYENEAINKALVKKKETKPTNSIRS